MVHAGVTTVGASKARTSKMTFNRQERYSVRDSAMVLYQGVVIPYWEYRKAVEEDMS